MRRWAVAWIGLALVNLNCSGNILETFANKDTNEAHYYNAVGDVNAGNYTGALNEISLMTGSYPQTAPVLQLQASAYAGMGGLQFINFVTSFSIMGTTRLLPFLLKAFDAGVASNIDNSMQAQTIMQSIGAIASRTADENFFSAVVAFETAGNVLSYYADPTHTGSPTSGWDPCASAGSRSPGGAMTDADVGIIGASLSIALADLNAVAGQVSLGGTSLTTIGNVCSGLPAGYNFCAVTDPTAFTATELKGIRSLIKESSAVGLGDNCTGDVTTCNCP
jgi:hypothetical protein